MQAAKIDPLALVEILENIEIIVIVKELCFLAKVFLLSQPNKIRKDLNQSIFLTSVLHINETGVLQVNV